MAAASAKGKGVLSVSVGARSEEEVNSEERIEESPAALLSHAKMPARNASSKYDFVKVKVWLGDNADHYYVLSRFLLSRMLTVTKIPNHVAIKIALELKKLLIDNSLLDVSQSDLEVNLFKLMERRGYGEEYINRYKMMTRFHHQRVPLVILVCGTACTGKSTIATQLAQRLNLPNVLQTDMVYELLRTSTDTSHSRLNEIGGPLHCYLLALQYYLDHISSSCIFSVLFSAPLASVPVWAREFDAPDELITEFCRECRIVRKGLAGDLKKAMKDGKPIIIEGTHLDPSIYLMDEENRLSVDLLKANKELKLSSGTSEDSISRHTEPGHDQLYPLVASGSEDRHGHEMGSQMVPTGTTELSSSTSPCPNEATAIQGNILKDKGTKLSSSVKKERPPSEPIIVPIVLKMAEFDHKALLEEWISTRTFGDKCPTQDQLISNLKTIQDYLCSFEARGLMVVNISATTFPQTLDRLHNYLLQCIEQGVSTSSVHGDKHSEQT